MKIIGIVPARYQSSRFPGKPLAIINGKSMIQRVTEQCLQCTAITQVIVATDDQRIAEHVTTLGYTAILTSDQHPSGTDRCYEAALKMNAAPQDIIINIQGDEPFISPAQISLLSDCFKDTAVNIATLVKKIDTPETLNNPNVPKVVLNTKGDALYFSRSPIPFLRNAPTSNWLTEQTYYKHIGIYGYRMQTLSEIVRLSPSSLEKAEALEQLRWLENGYTIKTVLTTIETIAVDTPDDLQKAILFGQTSGIQ